jgi:hypothetical protein
LRACQLKSKLSKLLKNSSSSQNNSQLSIFWEELQQLLPSQRRNMITPLTCSAWISQVTVQFKKAHQLRSSKKRKKKSKKNKSRRRRKNKRFRKRYRKNLKL